MCLIHLFGLFRRPLFLCSLWQNRWLGWLDHIIGLSNLELYDSTFDLSLKEHILWVGQMTVHQSIISLNLWVRQLIIWLIVTLNFAPLKLYTECDEWLYSQLLHWTLSVWNGYGLLTWVSRAFQSGYLIMAGCGWHISFHLNCTRSPQFGFWNSWPGSANFAETLKKPKEDTEREREISRPCRIYTAQWISWHLRQRARVPLLTGNTAYV